MVVIDGASRLVELFNNLGSATKGVYRRYEEG